MVLTLALAAVASADRVAAHHRFSDVYLENREIKIEGEVVEWDYRNPHSFVHIVTRNAQNEPERWIVECRGATQLRLQGVTQATFRPGQRIVVTGSPSRVTADRRVRLRMLVRPQDGWQMRDPGA
jgi:hypothetical protein